MGAAPVILLREIAVCEADEDAMLRIEIRDGEGKAARIVMDPAEVPALCAMLLQEANSRLARMGPRVLADLLSRGLGSNLMEPVPAKTAHIAQAGDEEMLTLHLGAAALLFRLPAGNIHGCDGPAGKYPNGPGDGE